MWWGDLGRKVGRFNLQKPSMTCLALYSIGMKAFKHDFSSIRSYLPRLLLHPFKEASGFCWTPAEKGSSSSLADIEFFLTAIFTHQS